MVTRRTTKPGKAHAPPSSKNSIVAAARAFQLGKEFDVDFDNVDRDFADNMSRLMHILKDGAFGDFVRALKLGASTVDSVDRGPDGGIRHHLRRDLFLLPAFGRGEDVEKLATDGRRMIQLSEIVRRSAATSLEDLLLLPVVIDQEDLVDPRLNGIRQAVIQACRYFDSADGYEDEEIAGMHASISSLLKERSDRPRIGPGRDPGSRMHALVGFASLRTVVADDAIPRTWTQEEMDGMLAAMRDVAGDRIVLDVPGDWAKSSVRLALRSLRQSLEEVFLANGLPPAVHVDTLLYDFMDGKKNVAFWAVVGGRHHGPVSIPFSVATQDTALLFEGFLRIADHAEMIHRWVGNAQPLVKPATAMFDPMSLPKASTRSLLAGTKIGLPGLPK